MGTSPGLAYKYRVPAQMVEFHKDWSKAPHPILKQTSIVPVKRTFVSHASSAIGLGDWALFLGEARVNIKMPFFTSTSVNLYRATRSRLLRNFRRRRAPLQQVKSEENLSAPPISSPLLQDAANPGLSRTRTRASERRARYSQLPSALPRIPSNEGIPPAVPRPQRRVPRPEPSLEEQAELAAKRASYHSLFRGSPRWSVGPT